MLLVTLLFAMTSFSQGVTYFYFPRQENSATTTAKMDNAEIHLVNAYGAYNEGNLEKTRYYLDQSERHGYVNSSFYYLLGQWAYDTGNNVAAQRYWNRGYKKRGCWECKELVAKMRAGKLPPPIGK